jgi:hypothetical protein
MYSATRPREEHHPMSAKGSRKALPFALGRFGSRTRTAAPPVSSPKTDHDRTAVTDCPEVCADSRSTAGRSQTPITGPAAKRRIPSRCGFRATCCAGMTCRRYRCVHRMCRRCTVSVKTYASEIWFAPVLFPGLKARGGHSVDPGQCPLIIARESDRYR